MRQTSGVIINNDIFINSSHVVKINKFNTYISNDMYEDSDSDSDFNSSNGNDVTPQPMMIKNPSNQPVNSYEYVINIHMLGVSDPIKLVFDNENDRDVIFNRVIMEMYGHNYAILNFETKK